MKSIILTCTTAITLLVLLAMPSPLAAQEPAESAGAKTANPVPLIDQPLVPDAIKPGGAGFTLTVSGTGFVSGSVVKWNGSARATTFVSTSQLKANILASDVATASTASVTVVSPGPGGGLSNTSFFDVTLSSPSVSLAGLGYSVGSSPHWISAGDFNGDGKLDLAIANRYGDTVSVLLGKGNGTFQNQVTYPTGSGPLGVAIGDFNRDSKLDLAVPDQTANTVSVLLGNGDGTFQAKVDHATGNEPLSVIVGDFNGDGTLDLAVTNGTDGTVSILLGNGDGTFQSEVSYPTGSRPFPVTTGDFNGDGKLDLAVGNQNANSVSILLGKGDGTFQPQVSYAAGSQVYSIATADFNKDGKLDLAVANFSDNTVSILLGKGDGTFQTQVTYATPSGPHTLITGDFNGDGKLDLAIANENASTLSILLGKGDGTFQAHVDYTTGSGAVSPVAGDFNGDGRLDLAIANYYDNTVSVLLQVTTVSLSSTSLTFADQVVGTSSAPQAVRLINTGALPLSIYGIAVAGTNATDFVQANSCDSSLPAGASCTISVTFKPTKLGPRTAAVTITDNGAGSPQRVALSGTGVTIGPNATLSTANLSYPTELVGTTSPAQSVKLSNYGTIALNIASVVASGDFSESNTCGSSLASGASCTVSVTFKPTQSGTRTGTLSITDNAPGSPQTVALNGTGTVVKLNPSSLFFHCHNRPNSCPPPPQTTTLTNTGNTTLSIGSIKIMGSTTFSQTNTCGSGVAAKGSCIITVTFKSSSRGTFSGALTVSDNGGGSPQQVALSATETKTGMSPAALSVLSTTGTAAVPSPTGLNNIGTRVVQMVDPMRDDPFLGNGTKRELLVRFWYPASINAGCEIAAYTSPAVWNYFSELLAMPLPEVRTNSCLDAPITEGTHPVVVFTHGYTGTFTDYTFIAEDLASRGYVVAAVDHTYEATAVEFPDGRMVKSVFGSHLAESTWRRDEQSLSAAVSVRLKDLQFVVDELGRLNGEAGGPFAGELDLTRIAVAGHSLGGLAAMLELKQDTRFKAAVLLDASMKDGSASLTKTPVLVLAMGRDQWSDEECRLWNDLSGPRFAVNLKGAEHVTPSDAVWLAKGAIKTGPMGPEKTIEALRNYIAAFLDTSLRGKPFDSLMAGPSSAYPDAAVTTQKQSLCVEAIDH